MKPRLPSLLLSAVLAFFMFTAMPYATTDVAEAADDVITWKVPAHWPSASASFTGSLKKVAEIIKERSDGKFIIEPYEAGSLIPGSQVFTAVKRGMYSMGVTSSAYNLDEVPILNVVAGLPMNFNEPWEGMYFHQWLGFEDLVKDIILENHGMLYFSDKIYPTEVALKKPVRSFEDFDGLKLRSSGILQKYLTSIGAAAQYISGGDVYAALASGVVDGAHWGAVHGNSNMNFYEICDYHLRPPLNIAATDIWLVNKKAFDGLPENLQNILVNTLEEHFWRRGNEYQYNEETELARIQKEEGVELIELPPEEVNKMREAAIKIWDEVAEKSPECAEAVKMIKKFNRDMGRLD